MEARAVVRHVRMSPRKMRVVANLVRGKRVEEAMGMLELMPKKGARHHLASCDHLGGRPTPSTQGRASTSTTLSIRRLHVDNGTIVKRWMPRSMGRANRIKHRTSHVTVVVVDED